MRSTRLSPATMLILLSAVLAVSSSAALVRWADASPVALAFWRTLGGALLLAPAARRSPAKPDRRQWWGITAAGLALGLHFATWLASLELTSVAASVSLVSTAPIMIAVALAVRGRTPGPLTWLAIVVAVAGTAVIAVGDAAVDGVTGTETGSSPLLGDGLALIGAGTMAFYLMTGDRLRADLSTAGYASRTYGVAAVTMLGVAVAGDIDLIGFDRTTWLAIGGMILGPQLAGHTALNFLLRRLGSVTVSLALLIEPLGAATLVWLIFGDVPPATALVGGPIVVGAVALHLLAHGRASASAGPTAAPTPIG